MPGTWSGAARAASNLAVNPATLGAMKYVGVPMAAGGAMYALNRPHGDPDAETLKHKTRRMQEGWMTGGGITGAALAERLTRGGSAPMRLFGTLGGLGLGAGLGYEFGTPMTAQYAWKHRMTKLHYPGGTDPATGLPSHFSPMSPQLDPNELRRMSRWGI